MVVKCPDIQNPIKGRQFQIRDAPGDQDGDCFFHAIYKVLLSERPRTLVKLCKAIECKEKTSRKIKRTCGICDEAAFIIAMRAALCKMIKESNDSIRGKSMVSAMYAHMMVLSVDEDIYQVVRENYPSWFINIFPRAKVLRGTTEAKFRKVLAHGVKQRHNYVQELELRLVQLLFRRIKIGRVHVVSGDVGEVFVFAKRTLYLYNRDNVHYLGVYKL
jgi:hypothetical protein